MFLRLPFGNTTFEFTELTSTRSREKSQSSRHIPCAVHLESWQKLDCGRHDGACLLLLSTADGTTERACYFLHDAANETSGQKKTAEDEPRRSNFCCFEQNLDKKPSALAEQRDYEGDFVEVFLAAFFLATFFLVAAFLGAAAFLAAAFLATFFFVAPAFFLATDTSSEMRKLWLPQYSIIRSSR